jgi:hypothetical protein
MFDDKNHIKHEVKHPFFIVNLGILLLILGGRAYYTTSSPPLALREG